MRFSIALVATALCALVSGQGSSTGPNAFKVPTGGYGSISAGNPVTLNWTPSTSGTVTLQLRSGNGGALGPGTTIASSIPNSGSYTFTPPASTVAGSDYTVEIVSDSDKSAVNYTPQFAIASTNTVSSAASSMSMTSSASASASSSGSSASTESITTSASTGSTASTASTASTMTTASTASTASMASTASTASSASSASKASSMSTMSTASTASAASKTASTTSAPSSGAGRALKVQRGLVALAMGVVAVW